MCINKAILAGPSANDLFPELVPGPVAHHTSQDVKNSPCLGLQICLQKLDSIKFAGSFLLACFSVGEAADLHHTMSLG